MKPMLKVKFWNVEIKAISQENKQWMKKFLMSGNCVARVTIILSQELRIGGTYCAILCKMATMVRFCQVNECPIREHIILHCKQYQMIVNAV